MPAQGRLTASCRSFSLHADCEHCLFAQAVTWPARAPSIDFASLLQKKKKKKASEAELLQKNRTVRDDASLAALRRHAKRKFSTWFVETPVSGAPSALYLALPGLLRHRVHKLFTLWYLDIDCPARMTGSLRLLVSKISFFGACSYLRNPCVLPSFLALQQRTGAIATAAWIKKSWLR